VALALACLLLLHGLQTVTVSRFVVVLIQPQHLARPCACMSWTPRDNDTYMCALSWLRI
jgi:hypothetical protein